ncbi:MAG: hypothetical protein Q4G47_05230, partial [Lachnospiraceae bacterium]|nr:hypothetical protein [Lachnospiraceae bacterium]
SYLLMASMTSCIHAMAEDGGCFDGYVRRLQRLRGRLASMQNLTLVGNAEDVEAGRYDPGKIYIRVNEGSVMPDGTPLTGPGLYEMLRAEFRLQPEMKTPDSVLMMTSPADTDEGFVRLEEALFAIDGRLRRGKTGPARKQSCPLPEVLPPAAMTIADAADAPSLRVPLERAEGRIAADYVIVYPPDSPVIVPGEVYTEEVMAGIEKLLGMGLAVTGATGGVLVVTE